MELGKTILIYYSFEGNTHFVATEIASRLGCDMLRIEPAQEIKSHGFMKYVWGGRQAFMKKTPPLKEYDLDTDAYDTFIVGSPVWAWTYSPPLRTFFSQNDIEGKNVVVFCCHEGGMGNTLKEMEMAMKWNKFLAEADFKAPLKNREQTIAKIEKLVSELK